MAKGYDREDKKKFAKMFMGVYVLAINCRDKTLESYVAKQILWKGKTNKNKGRILKITYIHITFKHKKHLVVTFFANNKDIKI